MEILYLHKQKGEFERRRFVIIKKNLNMLHFHYVQYAMIAFVFFMILY